MSATSSQMLFFQFFQGLVAKKANVTVELKNDLCVQGILVSVDQFLNLRLNDVVFSDPEKHPQMVGVCRIGGWTFRFCVSRS